MNEETPPPRKRGPLQRFFVTGLAGILPAALTIGILVWFFGTIDTYIGQPVYDLLLGQLIRQELKRSEQEVRVRHAGQSPARIRRLVREERRALIEEYKDDLGAVAVIRPVLVLLLVLVAVLALGFFLATFFGRQLLRLFEYFVRHTPIVKTVYPHAKQIVTFLFSEQPKEFEAVVALEYPRKGLLSLGFITGNGMRCLEQKCGGRDWVNVFIPSAPTPMTGYVLWVPRDEVVPLPITVDQALRFCVSGGVLLPEKQLRPLPEGTVSLGPALLESLQIEDEAKK